LPAKLIHARLGHCNFETAKRSLKATTGLELPKGANMELLCETCALGKSIRQSTPKIGSAPDEILAVIEIENQGPFPTLANDGTRSSIKFIDAKSGYCVMSTIESKSADVVLNIFKKLQASYERETGISATKCRFLGYADDAVKGYELLRLSDHQVIYSRDVVFDEIAPIRTLLQ
jgi:hypothetical protein